jgi:hypothetical protein
MSPRRNHEAQHEFSKPEVRIVLHDVNDDWLGSDGNHRFWNRVIYAADSRAFAAAQENDFHQTDPREFGLEGAGRPARDEASLAESCVRDIGISSLESVLLTTDEDRRWQLRAP